MKFDDIPDDSALIHLPDLEEWAIETPETLLSVPSFSGAYTGDIDRTIIFRALNNGVVGLDSPLRIRYEIIGEEEWQNILDFGTPYVPGDTVSCLFVHEVSWDTLDLGLRVSFSSGSIDSNGVFFLGCEEFEGFHIWRGIRSDGTDMEVIGEVSKEEAEKGSVIDSVYFYEIVPALRESGRYYFEEAVSCFGDKVELSLKPEQLFWVDCNAFNGFTYYYAVTTFDRGYSVRSRRQGLTKFDSFGPCDSTGTGLPCDTGRFVKVSINVPPQNNLYRIYAVPNPYRTGGSAYTTPNYHNFPDQKIRFVNVPSDCKLAIYTTAGDLIWETEHHSSLGNIEWDTRNSGGEEVTSGIYVYKVEAGEGNLMYGRLVIIR